MLNDFFNDYLDLVNDIDEDFSEDSAQKLIKEVKNKVLYLCKIQKKYNKNKDIIIKRLGKSGTNVSFQSSEDNVNTTEIDLYNLDNKTEQKYKDNDTGDTGEDFEKSNDTVDVDIEKTECDETVNLEKVKQDLMKKCFKSIAKTCHPDKTNDIAKNKIFRYAKHSVKNDDIIKILYLIGESNLKTIRLDKNEVKVIESCLENVEKSIHKMKNTVAYVWHKLSEFQKINFLTNLKIQQ